MDCQQLYSAKPKNSLTEHAVELELNRYKCLIQLGGGKIAAHKITKAEMIKMINCHWSYDKAIQQKTF